MIKGDGVEIFESVTILGEDKIELGFMTRIDSHCKLEGGKGLILGKHIHIASFSHLNTGGGRLIMEDFSGCGSGACIITGQPDYHFLYHCPNSPIKHEPIREETIIGKFAMIGARVTILPGLYIGKRAIIGAGSVVTHDVGDDEVWYGNPARFIKFRWGAGGDIPL